MDSNDEITTLRANLARVRERLTDRHARVRELQERNRRLRVRARSSDSFAKRYLDRTVGFASTLREVGFEPPDLLLAHDTTSLAATTLFDSSQTFLLADVVEIPVLSERSGHAAIEFSRDPEWVDLIYRYERSLLMECSLVTTVSDSLNCWLEPRVPETPIVTVQNCRADWLDKPTSAIRRDCGLPSKDTLVLLPNRLGDQTELEIVKSAFQRLEPTIHLAILGPSDDQIEQLKPQLAVLGSRVHYLPRQPNEHLVKYISGADVALVSLRPTRLNLAFALPNRTFEAVAALLPIVAGEGSETAKIVQRYGAGETYPVESAEGLAKALAQAVDRQGNGTYDTQLQRARRNLTWETESQKLLSHLPPGARALLIANKPIESNDRIRRLCATLVAADYQVSVIANTLPDPGLRVETVEYHDLVWDAPPKTQHVPPSK